MADYEFVGPYQLPRLLADENVGRMDYSSVLVTAMTSALEEVASDSGWQNGYLSEGTDLDVIKDPGTYTVVKSWEVLNGPPAWPDASYTLEVINMGLAWTLQRATNETGQVFMRAATGAQGSTTFRPWLDVTGWQKDPLQDGADLDTLLEPGAYTVVRSWIVNGGPEDWGDSSYTLEVLRMGVTWTLQRATNADREQMTRARAAGVWSPWTKAASSGGGTGVGGEARTAMESTGEWTTHPQEGDYLDNLEQHKEVTQFVVGTSVENRQIHGIQIGDPSKPAVLLVGTQHGNEPGSREGALIFARELAQATTQALVDLCVVIVPTLNPDRLHVARTNANGIDLNRDWVDLSQPETQAIDALFGNYNVVAVVDAHSGGHPTNVTLREAEAQAKAETLTLSRRLYDNVRAMYEAEDQPVARYDSHVSFIDDPRLFRDRAASFYEAASLLLEVPHPPPYHWQAHVALLCFRETVNTVWSGLAEYVAAKNA